MVLNIHHQVVQHRQQLFQDRSNTVGLDGCMDSPHLQSAQQLLYPFRLERNLAAGEGNTAAFKKHGGAADAFGDQFLHFVFLASRDCQSFRIRAPGTAKVAALQVIDQPVSRPVLREVKAFLKDLQAAHLIASFPGQKVISARWMIWS